MIKLPAEAELLRVFIGESDHYGGQPLYEAIIQEARRQVGALQALVQKPLQLQSNGPLSGIVSRFQPQSPRPSGIHIPDPEFGRFDHRQIP